MWSRMNVVGMKRRWAGLETDLARNGSRAVNRSTNGREAGKEDIKRAFVAKDIVIDCQQAGCPGKYLPSKRELGDEGYKGACVILRCTREPDEHAFRVEIEPLTADEKAKLKAVHAKGEEPVCERCGTPLELKSVETSDPWSEKATYEDAFCCSWCGLKAVLDGDLTCVEAG